MTKNKDNQLTPARGYNPNRMIFSEPKECSIPDSKIVYKRINISTENPDGSFGDLIMPTERCFSFGVSENTSQDKEKKVTGWTFPICLWSKDGVTVPERVWTDTFNKVVDRCVDHVLDSQEELELYDVERSSLTKSKGGMNPLYWKKEKVTDEKTGKVVVRKVPGQGPMLYPKLIHSKKSNSFMTKFFGVDDEPIDPLTLMGQYLHAVSAIKIESIYIGANEKISLQVKLYEAVVEHAEGTMKRLLDCRVPTPRSRVLASQRENANDEMVCDSSDEEEDH